jgi:hypothetical protein
MICFLVSIAALLLAAAGMARHIWLQRAALRNGPPADGSLFPRDKRDLVLDPAEEADVEP